MWTPDSLNRFIETFRETRRLRQRQAERRNRTGANVERVEPRVMLSISHAADAAAPDVRVALAAASAATHHAPRALVFVDASVAGSANLPADADVVTLDAGGDALAQITRELAGRRGVRAVHIVSHGAAGRVQLAGRDVVRQDLFERASDLRRWRDALADDAVINLYGCDVAAGDAGHAFVKALHRLTGATVAASDDVTGPAALGGDSALEYVAGSRREVRGVLSAESFGVSLTAYTITPSGGVTTHLVGNGAAAVDAGVAVSAAGTATSGTVTIASGYRIGEDVLAVTYPNFSGSFNAVNGVLTITSGAGRTAAEWQAAFRAVTFDTATSAPNLSARGVTFAVGSDTSAAKTVTPDLTVDEAMQARIVEALNVVEKIGDKIAAISGTPGKDVTTEVPFTGGLRVTDLLYPNAEALGSDGNPVANYSASVQPQGIGSYLALKTAAETYFAGIGLTNDLTAFVTAIQARMATLMAGTSATGTVAVTWTKPAASDARSLALTFTIANAKGTNIELSLPDLERDLGLYLPTPPTVSVGGGADIEFTVTLDLQGHTYGGALAQNKTTLAFARLNSLAGFSFSGVTTTAEFGLIRGQLVGASGVVGAKIPVTFGGSGASRTLNLWATDGSDATGFSSTLSGSATLTLPVTAGIGGVSATTANTKVVVTDADLFDSAPPAYATTDFSKLLYFGTLKVEDVIQEILKVKDLYATLSNSGDAQLGIDVPFLKGKTAGELLDLAALFKAAVGDKVDVYEPVLNTPGRDELTDWRLPISADTTPKPAMWSDLRADFTFGVVVNDAWPVHTVTVAADGARNTLADLVADVNAALATAGLDIEAVVVKSKMSLKATDVSVRRFAVVPVAPAAGRLSPTAPASDLSTLTANAAYYYTVTGATGSATGTNYYSVGTSVAVAAVHAGLLAVGETGVVKVTRVGTMDVWGSTRASIASADGSGVNAYLIESGRSDIRRLGLVAYEGDLRVMESFADGRVRATLPLLADLSAAAAFKVGDGTTTYDVAVADNGRTSVADTLADVKTALVAAGVSATDLTARLVDPDGTELTDAPAVGVDYRLELYAPEGSTWTTVTLAPKSDAEGFRATALGFLVGDVSAQPRPSALRTFEDFSNATLFPGITITPAYDATENTVTLQFAASATTTPTVTAGFDFSAKPLGRVTPTNAALTFAPTVTANLAFGLEFQVKPSNPITIASDTSVPATGRLTTDAHFSLDLVLQDKFAVTVPAAWTTANADVQDLVADLNRALKVAVPSGGGTIDLTTDRVVARRMGATDQFELVTATPVSGAAAVEPTHTAGVLSSDLAYAFTYAGVHYVATVSAAATASNTSFGDLIAQLNAALSLAAVDADADGVADADEEVESLAGKLFFTNIADGTVAGDSKAYLFTTAASSAWPGTITLSAARTDSAVTELGFDDNGSGTTSTTTARAGGATAVLRNHSNGSPLAGGSVALTVPTFAGSVQYGFNTLNFTGTTGGSVSVGLGMELKTGVTAGTSDAGSALATYFDRTLTGAAGTGNAAAAITLSGITTPGSSDIASGATIRLSIADASATTAVVAQALGVPIPVPQANANGTLSANATVNFLYGGAKYSVTVPTATAAGHTTFAQLAADFDDALATATKTVAGVATAGFDASGLFSIAEDAGQLAISALVRTANPNYATATFLPGLASFGRVGLQGAFGPAAVADALTDVLPALDALQSGSDLFANVPLPLVDARVNELIDIKGTLLRKIDAFRDMTVSAPDQIAAALAAALSVPTGSVAVTFDAANSAYRIDVKYETGIATAKVLDLTLGDYFKFADANLPEGLGRIVDQAAKSPLTVKIKATTVLSVGIDLTDPNAPRAFLYGNDGHGLALANGTSVKLDIEATADDITFTQSFGLFNAYVKDGAATLAGPVVVDDDSGDPVYEFDDALKQLRLKREPGAASLTAVLAAGKHYLAPVNAESDASDLANWTTEFAGSAEVNLLLFAPTEFTHPFAPRQEEAFVDGEGAVEKTVAGNVLTVRVPDLNQYAQDVLTASQLQEEMAQIYSAAGGSPSGGQQASIDAKSAALDALKGNGTVEAYAPDVADADSTREPTVLDVIRDPSLLVAGIDTVLGTVESGLRTLDNLNIPVIGPVLGDAVDSVFSFRTGWLESLKHDLRGAGEGAFEALKQNVYDFLGPNGIDLLLKDNGISSVDGLIPADSPDDVTLDFLDADGQKMTGLGGTGADAVEFKVRLGQTLLDTGADLSFDFDSLAPALSLGIDGGLTFKVGWNLTLGFGLSVTKGFYIVVDSAPTANEIELRFEAGLSGRQVGFAVAADAGSPTGYAIKDAAGAQVTGPRKGDGTSDPLYVVAVNANGQNVSSQTAAANLPDANCVDEDPAAAPSTAAKTYWVVAVDNGSGTYVPAYIDKLGFYRPMAGATWTSFNGSASRNPDLMVQYNQTAPFSAYGSLFVFNLAAVDQVRTGLAPKGDADYYYNPAAASTVTSYGRNNATAGVNRNNKLPTRIAGRIGIDLVDPSSGSGDYVARPGFTPTGFQLYDGTTPLGGEPVLDDAGNPIPVMMDGDDWFLAELRDGGNPAVSADYEPGDPITADESENRLTLTELSQTPLEDVVKLKLNAEAVVNLSLTLKVSDDANIPRLTATFNLDWRTDSKVPPPNPFQTTDEEKADLVPEVGVNDIRLDLGSFLTKLIKPIAVKIDGALKPIDPLITALNTKIPVISSVAGRDIKLSTLLVTFGGPYGQAIGTVIDMVTLVRQLTGVMAAVPDGVNVYLPVGNFWLAKVSAGPLGQPGLGKQIYYDNNEVSAPSITQRNQSMIADSSQGLGAVTNALGKLDQMDRKNGDPQPGISDQGKKGGFEVPILQDPMTIFKLMMGEDVPLVTFTLPTVDFSFNADIPLVKIFVLEVGLRLGFQVRAQLAMGYDTYGFRLFKDSHDPADFLQGFYISDRANADGTGADVDEFYLRATIALYGGVDLYLAKAGIEGGLNFTASVNLNDPNNDGKLRVMEAVELVKQTGNPLDLADISMGAEVYARYYYWVGLKIWTPWKTYKVTLYEGGNTFARMTIFSLSRDGSDGPPVFAAKVNTVDPAGAGSVPTLLLNTGPNAGKRVSNQDPLKTKDGAERVKIWNDSPGSQTVHVQYLNYSSSTTQTFTGVQRVVVAGGAGDDDIDASGLNGLPVEIDGGTGNDTIKLGSGHATTESVVTGGSGNDSITISGGGNLRIEGGDGNDTIDASAGTGTNTIDGGAGNDTIKAGGSGSTNRVNFKRAFGVDSVTLDAAAIANVLSFIESTLPVTGTLGGVGSTVYAGDTNKATFSLGATTQIIGSDGNDTFNLTNPTTRTANAGKGLILTGGPGNDAYNVVGDDLSGVSADGVTIDDGIRPSTTATLGTAVIKGSCKHLKSIPIAGGGLGYATAPEVVITDATGHGARAVAGIDDKGRVTGIYMLDEGEDYTAPIVALVDDVSRGDSLTFTSNTTGTLALDRASNGGRSDYRLSDADGHAIKFVGWTSPGTTRPGNWNYSEPDNVTVNLPTGALDLQAHLDVLDTFTVNARQFIQHAAITADTVKITAERGVQIAKPVQVTNNGDVTIRVTGQNLANYANAIATATATVSGGAITGFTVTNPGAFYDFAPVVSILDDRGYGARGVATIDASGHVTGVTLLDGGFGYLNSPAPRVVIAPPASIQLAANVSSSTVGSAPGTGDGRGQVTLRADLGAITNAGEVAFPTDSEIEWKQGDFRYKSSDSLDDITTTAYPSTSGGQGAAAHVVLDADGRIGSIDVDAGGSGYSSDLLPTVLIEGAGSATAVVDGGGHITGFRVTNPGFGYPTAPTVTILSNGFGKIVGADATATALNRTHIKSANGSLVAVAYYGIGDPARPIKTDVARMVAQTLGDGAGVHVLEKDGVRIGSIDHVDGISTIDGNVSVTTFAGTIHLGQPVQATNSAGNLLWEDAARTIPIFVRDAGGNIVYEGGQLQVGDAQIKLTADDVEINSFVGASGGQLILQPVKYDAPIGLHGTKARATLAVDANGHVTGTSTLYSGRGYATPPLVVINPPGERAFGVANVLAGELSSINVTFGGKGYNADYLPTITLVGGGQNGATPATPATAVATYDADGVVTGVTITAGGSGYYAAPEVRFALPGVQATAEAVVVDGKVASLRMLNQGANYPAAPTVEVQQPYTFGLEAEEIAYLEHGFREVVIGREDGSHTFNAVGATFNDATRLRAPRTGGNMQVEGLSVAAGPLTIVGSGHTLNLTSATPNVTGTFVEVDDNIIVHDGTNAQITATTGYVTIFGVGKGKIDGEAGSTSENLSITDVGDVTVTGAIGSTDPIHDLTINSSGAGNIALQQAVTIEGDLHIVKGGNITFGGALVVGGNLVIDEGASVNFAGTVTVGGGMTVSKATTVTFAANVAVTGSLLLGNASDPTKLQAVTFGPNARLDVSGSAAVYASEDIAFGNRVGNTRVPTSLTLRSDTGSVSFAAQVFVTGGMLTVQKTLDLTFGHDVTAATLSVTAEGETRFNRAVYAGTLNVLSRNLVVFSNQLNVSTGSATITSDEVDFAGGSSSVKATGAAIGAAVLTVQPYTTARDIAVGSPPAVFDAMDINDTDLAAIGGTFLRVVIGDAAAGTGAVTIGSIGTQQGGTISRLANSTAIYGGTVSVVQGVDMALSSGTLTLQARTGNVTVDAAISGTALERGSVVRLEALAGSIAINQPVYASSQVQLVAAGAVTEGAGGFISTVGLRVTAGGAVTLLHASNALTTVAMAVNSAAAQLREDSGYAIGTVDGVSGINAGTGNVTLTTVGGTVTQTQAIVAAGLSLQGAGAVWTLTTATNDVDTLTANTGKVTFTDADDLAVGTIGASTGITATDNVALTSATTLSLNAPIATSGTGTVAVTSTGGALSIAAAGDIASARAVTLAGQTGITSAGDISTVSGAITLSSAAGAIALDGTTAATAGNVSVTASGTVAVNSAVTTTTSGNVTVTSTGASVTTAAAGDITSVGTIGVSAVTGVTSAGDLTSAGNVTVSASAGPVTVSGAAQATGGNVVYTATGAMGVSAAVRTVTTGDVSITSSAGTVTIAAAGDVTSAHNVTIAGRDGVDSDGDVSAVFAVSITSSTGTVTLDGTTASSSGAITATAQSHAVVTAAITAVGAAGNVTVTSNAGSVTLGAAADVAASVAATVSAATGIDSAADMTASVGPVLLTTTAGMLVSSGAITCTFGSVTLHAGDDVNMTGSVTAGTFIDVTSGHGVNGGAVLHAGTTVTLDAAGDLRSDAAVTAGGAVLMTADGEMHQTAPITTDGTVTLSAPSAALTTFGGISAGGAVTITAFGIEAKGTFGTTDDDVTFNGGVTLIDAASINTGDAGPGDVRFSNRLDGAYALAIEAGTGDVRFADEVGGSAPLASLYVTSGDVVTFASAATTTGVLSVEATTINLATTYTSDDADMTFAGNVRLTSNVRLDTQGGDLTIASIWGIYNSLVIETAGGTATVTGDALALDFVTLHDDDALATGAVFFRGDLAATRLYTVGRAYDVSMTGDSSVVNEFVTFLNTGTVTLGDATTDYIGFNAGGRAAGSATNPSQVRLAGALTAQAGPLTLGPVLLTADSSVQTVSQDLTFAGAVDGGYDLRLDTATGHIAFGGKVGHATPLDAITINTHGGLTAAETIEATSLTQDAATGTTTFNGTVTTTGAAGVDVAGTDVTFAAAVAATGTGNVAVTASGDATFGGTLATAGTTGVTVASTNATFSGAVTTTGGGEVTVTTTADTAFASTLTTDGDVVVNATGDATFTGAVATAGTTGVTVTATNASFGDTVTTTNGGTVTVTTSAAAHFGGAVNTAGDLKVDAGTAADFDATVTTAGAAGVEIDAASVDFDGAVTVSGGGKLQVDVTGTANFDGVVSTASAGGVNVNAADAAFNAAVTTTDGGSVFVVTTGDTHFGGAVTAAADLIASGAAVDFDAAVSTAGAIGVDVDAASADFDSTVHVTGTGSLDVDVAGLANFDGAVTVDSADGIVIHAADAAFNAAVSTTDGGDVAVTTTGDTTFASTLTTDGDVAVTATGDATFTGAVATAGTTGVTVTATNATFSSTVDATNGGTVRVTTTADTHFGGAVTTAGDVVVSGAAVTFAAAVITAGGAGVDVDAASADFDAAVTVNGTGALNVAVTGLANFDGAVVVNSAGGAAVTAADSAFNSTLTTTAGGSASVTTTATAHFGGAINLAGNLIVDAGGAADFDATVTTAGSVGVEIDATSVDFDSTVTVTGAGKLDVSVTGTANFDGAVSTASAGGISLVATDAAFHAPVTVTHGGGMTVSHTGTLALDAAADLTLDGAFAQTGAGTVRTAADVATTGDAVTFHGPVVLTGDVAVATAGGAVTFDSTLNGTFDLTLTAGAGDVTFTGAVGGTARLADVTVASAGDVTLESGFAAATVTATASGEVAVRGLLDTTAGGGVHVTAASARVASTGDVATHGGPVAVTTTVGKIIVEDGATVDAGNGTITLFADGDVMLTGLITTNATANAVSVTSATSHIIDNGDSALDVVANAPGAVVTLRAVWGIGDGGAHGSLDTDIAKLDAVTSHDGPVRVSDVGAIELANVTTPNGDITVTAGGTITATTVDTDSGTVSLTATAGDVLVGRVSATTAATLTAAAGKVLDTGVSAVDGVTAAAVTLTGRQGVGTAVAPVRVVADAIVARAADADTGVATDGDVYINSAGLTGGTATADVSAAEGAITIAHAGSSDLALMAATTDGPISATVTGGTLTATSVVAGGNGTVALTTVTAGKAVRLGSVTAADSPVVVTSAGDIVEAGDDAGVDVTAGALSLDAAGAIGAAGNPIEVDADVLSAHARGGGVFVGDANTVTVTELVASGDVAVTAVDRIRLNAVDPVRSDESLTVNSPASRDITFTAPAIEAVADLVVSTGAGAGDVRFAGTFWGDGNVLTLTAGTGDVTFDHELWDVSGLTVVSATAADFGSNVQAWTGGVTLQSIDTASFHGSVDVTGGLTVAAARDLTFDTFLSVNGDVSLTATGTVTFDGTVAIGGDLTIGANHAGDTGSVYANANFGVGGDLTVDHDGLARFADGINFNVGGDTRFTGTGRVEFGSVTYVTGGDISFDTAPVVLTSNTVIDAGTGGGDVTFSQPVSGDYTLTILASGGHVVFGQPAGTDDAPLRGLTVTNAADVRFDQGVNVSSDVTLTATGDVNFVSSLDAGGAVDVAAGGSVNFGDAVTADGGLAIDAGGAIDLREPVAVTSGLTDLAHGGTLHVYAGAELNLAGGLHERGPGAVVLDGVSVTTAGGDVTFDGDVTTTGDLPVTTAGGDVAFNGTLDGAHAITVTAGAGDVAFNGDVGSASPASALAASGRTIVVGAGLTTAPTAGATLTATRDVWLGGGADVSTGGAFVATAGGVFGMAAGSTLTARDGSDVIVTSEDVAIGAAPNSIHGTGVIVLQPLSGSRAIVVGTPDAHGVQSPIGAGPAFDLGSTELAALDTSFRTVLIGRGRAGGFDTGDDGIHVVTVYNADFRSDVVVRAAGDGGAVTVRGVLHGLDNADLTVLAGGSVTVTGAVVATGTGDVRLNADADGNANGGVTVAAGARVAADSGDVLLLGNGVEVGTRDSAGGAEASSREGSVSLSTTSRAGQVFVWGRTSEVTAGIDVLVGTPDVPSTSPSFIRIEGNVTSGRHIRVHGADAVEMGGFRLRARGLLNVAADGNLTAIDGTAISQGGDVVLAADADGNGVGAVAESDVRRSQPDGVTVGITLNAVKLKGGNALVAGAKGKATVTLTNLGATAIDGFVRAMVYASTDGVPDAADAVIARLARVVKIKAGGSKKLTLPVLLPADLPPGDYTVIAEVLPYRPDRPASAPNAATDPNVNVSGITLRVRRPDLVATGKSTFDGKAWDAGAAGKVTVTVTNAGEVAGAGPATVVAYASPDGTLANAVEVARWSGQSLSLKAGKSKALTAAVKLPGALAGQTWTVLAVVNPDGAFPEADLANNSGLAARGFEVRAAA